MFIAMAMCTSAIAGILAVGASRKPDPVETAQPVDTQEVLTAARDVAAGESLRGAVIWTAWPASLVTSSVITRRSQPDALSEYEHRTVQNRLFAGDPIRIQHFNKPLVNAMSASLPAGMRAVAIKVSSETTAGGFILPGDFVDVIMSRKRNDSNKGSERDAAVFGEQPSYVTETILANVRVLAIDQDISDETASKTTLLGQTATLELTQRQAEIVTVAQQLSDRLTLTLRSSAEKDVQVMRDADHLILSPDAGEGIRVISGGSVHEFGVIH
ncbi:pilus assembly protein CpaB [Ochrobactrum sp. BH3]|nr:pilus assembly protein CpaB [Ochrobactrum sp. BH3]